MRGREWTGFHPGAPRVVLRRDGASSGTRAGTRSISAFATDAAALDRAVAALRADPPALIEGDTEALAILAAHVGGHERLAVRAVLASGQTLTPALREVIECALGGSVFDAYATREFGTVAQECPTHQGLHVSSENVLIEVTRNGRPVAEGQLGDVLVTDLVNRCVPLLRYRLGDTAALVTEPCACGRSLPRLIGLAGRPAGAAVGTSGQLVPAVFFAELFQELEFAVAGYQVTQERTGHLAVRLVCRSRFGADTERRVRAALAAVLGPDLQVSLERVERLPLGSPAFEGHLAPAPLNASPGRAAPGDACQEALR